jgi:hypothetical protein
MVVDLCGDIRCPGVVCGHNVRPNARFDVTGAHGPGGSTAERHGGGEKTATILPVVKEQHQLLVTLLLCNAAAMEALPIFLDTMFNEVVAVILSVTFVLAFGEVRSYTYSHPAPKFNLLQCAA